MRNCRKIPLKIAGDICVFTNLNHTIEELPFNQNLKELIMSEMTPREIVSELDRHIIGQSEAKRAVGLLLYVIAGEECSYRILYVMK